MDTIDQPRVHFSQRFPVGFAEFCFYAIREHRIFIYIDFFLETSTRGTNLAPSYDATIRKILCEHCFRDVLQYGKDREHGWTAV